MDVMMFKQVSRKLVKKFGKTLQEETEEDFDPWVNLEARQTFDHAALVMTAAAKFKAGLVNTSRSDGFNVESLKKSAWKDDDWIGYDEHYRWSSFTGVHYSPSCWGSLHHGQ